MKILSKNFLFRILLAGTLLFMLSGCVYWLRAYETYLQLDDFDHYFVIDDHQTFVVHFNSPVLFSEDFVSLSKLQPSSVHSLANGKKWRYLFRKVDASQNQIQPELSFFFDLDFNQQDKISAWIFSPLFLELAPSQFLEASLRSLAGGKIDKDKRQLHANASTLTKVAANLPQKANVISRLGQPVEIKDEGGQEIYYYHFLLDTPAIEEGYEDRALSVVKLTFDKSSQELIRMAGRFAGLKISINYRKFLANNQDDDDSNAS